jgi:proteasome lid subunit RPN8/RPN11
MKGAKFEKNTSSTPGTSAAGTNVSVADWKELKRPAYREFPGPRSAEALLRVAFEGHAYSDFIAHAKSSLEVEICGVLVGHVYADEKGEFVYVQAIIQGDSARKASTHVTFTQETWNNIHQTLERHYPKMQIVGWYHSHPGFGVEFSDMDIFIQKNFFPAPTQIALLTDPMSGDTAICINTSEGMARLERFWVNSREVRCRVPASKTTAPATDATGFSADLQTLETRLNQYIQSAEEQRRSLQSFIVFAAMLVTVGVLAWVGYQVYKFYTEDSVVKVIQDLRPIAIPVQIGDKTLILAVQIVGVEVLKPPDKPKPEEPKATNPAPGESKPTGGKSP